MYHYDCFHLRLYRVKKPMYLYIYIVQFCFVYKYMYVHVHMYTNRHISGDGHIHLLTYQEDFPLALLTVLIVYVHVYGERRIITYVLVHNPLNILLSYALPAIFPLDAYTLQLFYMHPLILPSTFYFLKKHVT